MLKNNLKDILNKNGIIIFPTDTVYGMGSLPIKRALDKIYLIKKRDENKKIVALVDSKEKAKSILKYNKLSYFLIDKFFPGPFTIVSKGKKEFLKKIDYEGYIGVRMPKSKIALEILKEAGGILMTTSVNISGKSSATSIEDIDDDIKKNVDYIIENNNEIISKRASSIFKIVDNDIIMLREGDISLEEVLSYKEEMKFERKNG